MKKTMPLLLFFVCHYCQAQFPEYYIYLYKGNVNVVSKANKKVKASSKQLIYATDHLQLEGDHPEVTLVNQKGKFVEVKGKGLYAVNTLKPSDNSAPSLTEAYFHMVWEELLDPSHQKSKIESIASSWGGGSRGSCDLTAFPRSGYKTSSDSLHFSWHTTGDSGDYHFIVYNSEGQEIINTSTADPKWWFLPKRSPQEIPIFYWSVQSGSKPCRTLAKNSFILLQPSKQQEIVEALIKKLPANEDAVLYNLAIADVLSRSGFFDEALQYVKKSKQLFDTY